VPKKQRKKRRLGCSDNSCVRKRAEYINHVWSYDFVTDRTEDGQSLKMLPVLDEFTRECLSIDVGRRTTSQDVIATLKYLFAVRGAPAYIRSDNGPKFIAELIKSWLSQSGVGTLYIEPGSHWLDKNSPDPNLHDNSAAHQGKGQNVLYKDGSVTFEKSVTVGIGGNNIYTYGDPETGGGDPNGHSPGLQWRRLPGRF